MLLINQILKQPTLLAYFIGANNYAWLQFRSGERRLLAKPLTYFEERLPSFIRIHKTALINPTFISSIAPPPRPKMAGSVQLLDGTNLPVSRRRWQNVSKVLQVNSGQNELTKTSISPLVNVDQPVENGLALRPVQAIMTGDALLLTQQCLNELGLPYTLEHTSYGAELASALLFCSPQEWPALILIDARTNRVDSLITLQTFKNHPRLRAIPVIWLVAPGEDMMPAYLLDANSVVIVPDDPTSFVRILKELFHYWLMISQLAA